MIKVAFYGVGDISCMTINRMLIREDLQIVAAVDVDPSKIGRDLGELANSSKPVGIQVSDDSKVLSEKKPEVTIHAVTSRLEKAYDQIMECVEAGSNVISTCEELYHPDIKDRRLGNGLDQAAKKLGVTVMATGINPGFMMDTLPIILSAPCVSVKSLKVQRVIDAAKRRIPFQAKVGMGLTIKQLAIKIEKKEITGHVGLDVSTAAIANALRIDLDKIIAPPPEPIIAEIDLDVGSRQIKKGMVSGLKNWAVGKRNGEDVINLEFSAFANPCEEFDSIQIEGEPSLNQKIIGGVHGDIGTVAMIINSIPQVINSLPGLYSTYNTIPIHTLPNKVDKYITKE